MDFFTVIALLLAVFGASYSANAALRSHFENTIRDGADGAEEKVEYIEKYDTAGTGHKSACDYHSTIKNTLLIWNWAHWIPILLFCVTAFGLSFYVCLRTQGQALPDLWDQGRWVLLTFVVLDIVCFFVALGAYWTFKHANVPLTRDYNACIERKNKAEVLKTIDKPADVRQG